MSPRIIKQALDNTKSDVTTVQKKKMKRKSRSTSDTKNLVSKKKPTLRNETSAALMTLATIPEKNSAVPVTYDEDMKSFNEQYNLEMLIGSGGYGKVYSATRKCDNQKVAVKEMLLCKIKNWTNDLHTNKRIPTEVVLLHKCQPAEGVIRLIEYFQSKTNALIVMEFNTDFVDLSNFTEDRKKLSHSQARHVIRQVVQTLATCQSLGVMHRDLKQQNVLIQTKNGSIKLLDFGLAQLIQNSNQRFTQFRGTPSYRPPEHIKTKEAFDDSFAVWSIGCFAYSLFFGDVPFKTKNEILTGIVTKQAEINTLSSDSRDFILQCLHPDPKSRPLLQELGSHPWISCSSGNSQSDTQYSLQL